MNDLLSKRHRKIDYRQIIKCLGLESAFIDYCYIEHPRLISVRRQARYFLQSKKVDILSVDIYIKQNDIWDYSKMFRSLSGDMSFCYLKKD